MYVIYEQKLIDTELGKKGDVTIIGVARTYEMAKSYCYRRISLAIDEDWGFELNKLVTEVYKWKIIQTSKV